MAGDDSEVVDGDIGVGLNEGTESIAKDEDIERLAGIEEIEAIVSMAVGIIAAIGVVYDGDTFGITIDDGPWEGVEVDFVVKTKGAFVTVVVDGESTSITEYLIDVAVVGEGVMVMTRVFVVSRPLIVFVVRT